MGVTSGKVETSKQFIRSECGYWEEYEVFSLFLNEIDTILGVITNCGQLKGIVGDVWVSWDYTVIDLDRKPTRMGYGSKDEMKGMVEGLLKL